MKENSTIEQAELVLRKINWAQKILNSVADNADTTQIADIISGVSFIMDSASDDAEKLYRLLR